jgi:hypothetical protein
MKTLTFLDISLAVLGDGFAVPDNAWSIADRVYMMPTRAWIEGAYSDALASVQEFFHTQEYAEEENDCDDFARLAASFAQILHHNTPGHPPATALAFGELWYKCDDGINHVLNIAICGGEVVTYEPQSLRIVTVSATEKQRVNAVRF